MISRQIFRISLFLFLLSCRDLKNDPPTAYTEIHIDNSKIEDITDLSDKIENITILSLKETKGNYIGGIFKLFAANKRYIVYDRLNTNRINAFDDQGYFIKTVAKVGDNLNDPLNINDCWINDKGELEVYDYAQMKIFQFDTSLNFIGVKKSLQFNHFVSLHNIPNSVNYAGYANYTQYNEPYKGKTYQFAFLDSGLNIKHAEKYFDKSLEGVSWLTYNQHFLTYKDTLRFVKAYDNFIYDISNFEINERFKIYYSEDPLPDDILPIVEEHLVEFKDEEINPNVKAAYFKPYYRFAGGWLETDKYVYVSSRDNKGMFGNYFFSLIDKVNNKTLFSTREFCETEKFKLTLPPFQYIDTKNTELIAVIDGQKLKEQLYPDSPFQNEVVADPEIFYLVKLKLK